MSIISIYAVFADENEANLIGQTVVDERLAACVNVLGPISSIYRWKGKVETADEVAAFFKTDASRADELISRIASLHSYDIPCVASLSIDKILKPYADWVEESVKPTTGRTKASKD